MEVVPVDGLLLLSLVDVLCNQLEFGLVQVTLSIHCANVRWWLQGNSLPVCNDGEGWRNGFYVPWEFSGAAVRLKDIGHYAISRGIELSDCASLLLIITFPTRIVRWVL
jgi:hypothetical protein